MEVACLTGAAQTCPQSNKSILPTFVLSKVEKLLRNEKPITLQNENVQTQNSKLKTQKINANNKIHLTYPTHPMSTASVQQYHPLPASAYLN